jgi:hypothetical protein
MNNVEPGNKLENALSALRYKDLFSGLLSIRALFSFNHS